MNNSKAENQSSPDRTAQRSNQGSERPIQILLIEDDPVYAELLQDLLINKNRNQWQLEVTTFLREGLEQLKRRPFDVVLADLYLPDSRGLDTVTGLLHVTELPVVVLTNMDNSNLALEAMRQGAQDYLLKGELSYRLLEKSIHYAIERSHTQTLLRQNEQHFRMALENSPITVFNQDTDLRYTWSFNPMSEFPAEVALGKHDIDLFSAADAQRLTAIKQRVLTTGIKTREETFITIGGVVRYFDLNVEPLRNAMGEIVGITCACTDITNYKQAEEALRLANTELENRVQQRTEELLSFQDTLRQREAEFRALLENSPDIISRLDRQFRHVYINPIIEQVTGLPPQSFIGKTNQELGMPEDKVEQWDRALNQVFETGQEVVIEFDFPSCDGIRYFQGCLVPERNQQGEVQTILGISRDITNLKHVESALRESEEKFRQLAENIQAVFWSFTPDRKEVIYISPAYEQIWGRSCDELELSDYFWEKAIYPDDCDRVLAKLPLLLEGKFDEEFRIVRPDGTIRWIHSRGFPIHNQRGEVYRIAGISWDINDKKQAELALQQLNQELELRVQQRTEALLESEARLQKLAAYAPGMLYQYVLRVDGTDAMLYGSPACQTIFEVEPEAVMENRNLLWSMVHPDDLQMLRDSIAESAQNLQPWHVEYRIITPSGQLKWLEATSQPEQQANGDMVWYGILNEISDRKQAEAALRESEEKFRQLAETIQEVFWLKGDDDQLLYVSPNYELIWGRSVQSLYQNHQEWCDSIHPDDHDRIMAANARKVENGYDQEYRMIRPDGEIRWIRDRAFPIFDTQGQVYRIAGIAEDISDRKQTEQALQKSQYFIQRVADTTPHL
ncbi:MAG TPA: PAS domain S-box protein, partial [Cyanophyceae cyanobacterium]